MEPGDILDKVKQILESEQEPAEKVDNILQAITNGGQEEGNPRPED